MSKTLDSISANIKLDLDFRKNSLKDQSGNSNDATVSGSPSYQNTRLGRGINFGRTSAFLTVTDSAELQSTNGFIFVFGKFEKEKINARFVSKRDAGGTNYDFSVDGTGAKLQLYDGTTVSTLAYDITGHNMLGVKFTATGAPVFYVDGVNVGSGSASLTISVDDADLTIGGLYNGALPAYNTIIKTVFINDSTVLSDTQVASIYEEYMQERGALHIPRRNYVYPTPKEEDTTTILHLDGSTKDNNGKFADLTGNSRAATINGSVIVDSDGPFSRSTRLTVSGSTPIGYLTLPTVDTDIWNTNTYSVMGWVKMHASTGAIGVLLGQAGIARYFGFTSADKLLLSYRQGAGLQQTVIGATALTAGKWQHIAATLNVNGANIDVNLYLDGTLDKTDSQALTIQTGSGNPVIGTFDDSPLSNGLDMNFANLRYFKNKELSATEVSADYAKGSKLPQFMQTMEDVPPTLANVTANRLGLTEFAVNSGTWAVSEDSTGKYLDCVATGQLQTPLVGANNMTTETFTKSGTPTLGKNATNLQVNGTTGEKIYSIVLTNG